MESMAAPAVLREVKGAMPDELARFAKSLDRFEEANRSLASFLERMGRYVEGGTTGEDCAPTPAGYLGDLSTYMDRLEAHCDRLATICKTAEGIG